MEFGYDPYCHCQYDDMPEYGTKRLTRRYQRGEHVMNKNEAAVMRRLQSETGLTEEQIREHKKYRILLSEAQAVPPAKRTNGEKAAERLLKTVTRKLKLAAAHPDVVAEAMQVAKDCDGGWRRWSYTGTMEQHMANLLRSKR
jgi:hypothetical protein